MVTADDGDCGCGGDGFNDEIDGDCVDGHGDADDGGDDDGDCHG